MLRLQVIAQPSLEESSASDARPAACPLLQP